jgi:uracil-DNA glycosylase
MLYDIKNVHLLFPEFWSEIFNDNKEELINIFNKINNDIVNGYRIFPFQHNIFKVFEMIKPNEIKLVIIGQDPYINSIIYNDIIIPQANGIAFSVHECHKIPPSLLNIFKEIKNCYPNYNIPTNGCLERWIIEEKIFLLNASLTVIENKSNSHNKYWINFTDKILEYISENNNEVIFLLMGNFAVNKISNNNKLLKHKIFTTSHPSPLSCYKNFLGSNVFKNINLYLESKNKIAIKW